MTLPQTAPNAADGYLVSLLEAGILIATDVSGVYGLSGQCERLIERFEGYVTRMGAHLRPEVMRFPPLISRQTYERTDHLQMFPNLMGSVHSFTGGTREHRELERLRSAGEAWTTELGSTGLMLTPAACYPLYPLSTGVVPDEGRLVDLRAFVFRHEPSSDPARMQIFRQREYVRIGSPQQAQAHRDYWLDRGRQMLDAVGLDVRPVVANDPFFGDAARLMAATQREQTLKYELVAPITSTERRRPLRRAITTAITLGRRSASRRATGGPPIRRASALASSESRWRSSRSTDSIRSPGPPPYAECSRDD